MSEADLSRRIDELTERLVAVENGLTGSIDPYMRLGFTRSESVVLATLMKRAEVDRDGLMFAIYGLRSDTPDPKIIDVWISHIRKKLAAYEVWIDRVRDGALSIPPHSKTRLRAALGGPANYNTQRAVG